MRICIVGGSGMLGHRLLVELSKAHDTWATVRRMTEPMCWLPNINPGHLIDNVDILDHESIVRAFAISHPDVVINCVGLIKQHEGAQSSLAAIQVNALLPHRLALLCQATGARLIHFSTDCVFSGKRGMYTEDDLPDPIDLYGRSKLLGEVDNLPHVLTLRTSLIGRELSTHYGLVEWFLSQQGTAQGYQRAVFSGFPTHIVADILRDYILPNPALSGMVHLSAAPINKYELLTLLKAAFHKEIDIVPDTRVAVDRSLNSARFRAATQFEPLTWPQMIASMAALTAD